MKTKLKILHLEDTPADAELVERELKKGNIQFETLVVGTKTAFEKALQEFVPDIIIADHSLPSFNSLDAIRIMKQKGIKIPIILVTATVSDEYAVEVMKAGADDYILKDRLHRLPQAVLNSMEKYSLESAKEAVIDELISSQLHLKEAQGIAKLGSWETDLQTFNIVWSEETHHIFETDLKILQVTHEVFLSFVHPDDRHKVNTAFENSLTSPLETSVEHRIISTNGTLKHVLENWKIVQDDKGHSVRAVGTCQDITERKHAEEEITKLSLVARKTSNAVVITDAEEKIQWVNDAFIFMTGFELNEIIGKRPGSFLQGPETDPEHVRYMRRKIRNREAFNCDTINYTKTGNKYWTRIQCQPEFDSTGELTGFFSIQTDITKDKEAEQAIYRLSERLTLATTSVKMGIWDWDVVNNKLIWDKTMYGIFGVAEDKFSGAYEAWAATVHPEDIDEENEKVQSALRGDTKFDSEFRIVWPDSSIRYIKGDAIVVRDDTGKPLRMIGTNLDITELKKAEREITDYKYALNKSSILAITDQKGIIKYVNKNFCDISKYSARELVGQDHRIINSGYHPKSYLKNLWVTIANGIIWKGELKNKAKDGTIYWVDTTIVPFLDEKGKPYQYMAIRSDITERKKAEENLRESEIRLKEAQAISHTANWEIDLITNLSSWSDEFYRIFGLEKGAIQPSLDAFYNLILPSDRPVARKGIREAFETFKDSNLNFSFKSKDGSLNYAYTEWRFEFDKDKKPVRLYGILQDTTERKIAEEKLEQQNIELKKTNAELDRFVYSTSHDLRAPLTSLQGLINIMDDSLPEAEHGQKELVGMMKQSITKLDSFIEDIISYSRNSRTEIEKEAINFEALINESLQTLKYMEGEPACEIKMEVVQMGKFISDNRRISIIINNLIGNAIKYQDKTKPNPYVTISVQSEESKAIITVEDNGIGIADDKQERIFEMFYRATKLSTGSGLGMYIVNETLEKLNGIIATKSKLDSGTTFTVSIPNLIEIK